MVTRALARSLYDINVVLLYDNQSKTEKENALDNIEKSDIIIGTKMITTGFDFK